jgi:methionyl-tRNA synthetase
MRYFRTPEEKRQWKEMLQRNNIQTPDDLVRLLEDMQVKLDREDLLYPAKSEGECHFCHTPTTNRDFCFWCKKHVCPTCTGDPKLAPIGPHTVDDHKAFTN